MNGPARARAPRGGALITGAARRIGRALVLAAAQAGYDVAIHARTADADAEATRAEAQALGARAAIVTAHLDDDGELSSLIARAAAAVGPLSLLINNASVFQDDRVGSISPASWDAHLAVNLRAPVLLAQAFAGQAPATGGLIVNILDQRVLKPAPHYFSYGVSKASLLQATTMLAQALAPRIRVNGIAPGPTLRSIHQKDGEFEAEQANVPLQRGGDPGEIADALRYLIDAPSVTGQIIAVDGGQHLAWRTPDILDP